MELKIEYLNKEELKPYANNAKVHTAEQIEQIKSSIEQFGFNDPIAIWKNNEIIEGHGRYISAKELGLKHVPVIRLDSLSDEERRVYMLVHNQLAMNTGFDFDVLEDELGKLYDIDMGKFGFKFYDEINVADFYTELEDKREVTCSACGFKFYVNSDGEVVE